MPQGGNNLKLIFYIFLLYFAALCLYLSYPKGGAFVKGGRRGARVKNMLQTPECAAYIAKHTYVPRRIRAHTAAAAANIRMRAAADIPPSALPRHFIAVLTPICGHVAQLTQRRNSCLQQNRRPKTGRRFCCFYIGEKDEKYFCKPFKTS